jgi:hypothetical protein
MKFPPLTTILAMYAINVGILWTATRFLAPSEKKPSVLRCLGTAVLMTFFGNATDKFLYPLIGAWVVLIKLIAFAIATMAVLKLAWWRSSLIALIFYAGIVAQYLFLFGETSQ